MVKKLVDKLKRWGSGLTVGLSAILSGCEMTPTQETALMKGVFGAGASQGNEKAAAGYQLVSPFHELNVAREGRSEVNIYPEYSQISQDMNFFVANLDRDNMASVCYLGEKISIVDLNENKGMRTYHLYKVKRNGEWELIKSTSSKNPLQWQMEIKEAGEYRAVRSFPGKERVEMYSFSVVE